MKPHYFNQEKADEDDHYLKLAKKQGYVPENCLLDGSLVMAIVNSGDDPCRECNCPREKCNGRKKGTCEEEEIPKRVDKSKIGMRDILGLIDVGHREFSIFAVDLVSNRCILCRNVMFNHYEDALSKIVSLLMEKGVTRIVIDSGMYEREHLEKMVDSMVSLPYCAVEKERFRPLIGGIK